MKAALLALFLASHMTGADLSDISWFCASHHAVACDGHHGHTLSFSEVKAVDAKFRKQFVYEDWKDRTSRGHKGNCSDYSLILSERLGMAGEDGRNMRLVFMTVCDPDDKPKCENHTRLWVLTSDHGFVEVDNMHAPGAVWNDGVHMGTMLEDGNEIVKPMPGYHVSLTGLDKN